MAAEETGGLWGLSQNIKKKSLDTIGRDFGREWLGSIFFSVKLTLLSLVKVGFGWGRIPLSLRPEGSEGNGGSESQSRDFSA